MPLCVLFTLVSHSGWRRTVCGEESDSPPVVWCIRYLSTQAGIDGYCLGDAHIDLGLIAGPVGTLCGIWANFESFQLASRCRTATVANSPFGSQQSLIGELRRSTCDSTC